MKPNFILDLSQDGIRLRAADGDADTVLGEVSLSEPDFDDKVTALRNAVAEKSDTPLATELRIPDSQILYTSLDDPDFDAKTAKGSREDLRGIAVREALEGMTPYALTDLNYIWKIKGKGELSVAAVAHETLAEAEQFAVSRGFNPVRFTADPGARKFKGTADFGPTRTQRTRAASEALAEAKARAEAKAETELRQIEGAGAQKVTAPPPEAPGADATAGPAPAAETSLPVKAEPATETDSFSASEPALPADTAVGHTPEIDAKPETAAPALPSPAATARRLNIAPTDKAPVVAAKQAGAPTLWPTSAKPQQTATKGRTPDATDGDAPRIGFSQPRVNDPLPPLDDSAVVDDVPAMPAVSFASRRKVGDGPAPTPNPRQSGALTPGIAADTGEKDSRLSRIAARFAVAPGADSMAKAAVPPPPPRRTPVGADSAAAKSTLRGSAGKPGIAGRAGPARTTPIVELPDNTAAAASLTPPGDTTRILGAATRARKTEAEAMTVFGARAASTHRSFTPLIIGIALIAALAIAIWAAFLLIGDEQVTGEAGALTPATEAVLGVPATDVPEIAALVPERDVAAPAAPDVVPETIAAPVLPQEQPSADTSGAAALPGTLDGAESAAGRLSTPDSTVATQGPVAPPVPPTPDAPMLSQAPPPPLANDLLQRPPAGDADSDNIVARYATTGVWVQTPGAPTAPETDRVDDLYIASVDPSIVQPRTPGATTLPVLSAPDTVLPQLPPAGPGQSFDLDETGLVRATPEGTISPDGILITAGAPPRRPPATPTRPDTLTPAAASQPDLPRTRPRDRPGDLPVNSPSDLAEDSDQSELALPDNSQFAALQPRPRPENAPAPTVTEPPAAIVEETVQDRARAAALSAAGASTATPQAPLSTRPPRAAPASLAALRPEPTPEPTPEPAPDPELEIAAAGPISPYAVARSRLPRERPNNIDRIVALARALAPEARAQPEPQVTRVAAPAAITTPSIPSRASVATQATVKNAINLGRINLIGVYGSTSNRSALVRLSSGKFVKLKVGDRVDGGRVAAIAQNQLSYTKGGRQVVLSMPNG